MDSLCSIRNLYKLIEQFEEELQSNYQLTLNEGMMLCELKNKSLASGEIANILSLSHSNTSKIIASLENKKLIKRSIGSKDKRKMIFAVTPLGSEKISALQCEEQTIHKMKEHIRNQLMK